jgi:hypothetical protein
MSKHTTHLVLFLWTWFGLLLSTLVVITIPSAAADATATADNTQVCTIDGKGQEICVDMTTTTTATTVPSSQSDPKSSLKRGKLCLPDGHCWDGLETALAEHFPSNKVDGEGTKVSLIKPVPFGDAQIVAGVDHAKTVQVLGDTYQYMVEIYSNDTAKSFRDGCQCRHENCAFWAAIGELRTKAKQKR